MIIHPECGCVTSCMQAKAAGDIAAHNGNGLHILSTEGMMRRTNQSTANEFIIATETGVLHRMRKACPAKTFHAISEDTICRYMKLITVDKVLHALRHMQHQVTVAPEIAARARGAIDRMLELA
jgi:quinolinate synthase